jgi:superfamily I DNA/RNA helicase
VSQCFRFIKDGRKANIQGRDVGQGLVSTIEKMKTKDMVELSTRLDDWLHAEVSKENAKKNPSEARVIALQDRYECLCCFMDSAQTVDNVIAAINAIFTDEQSGEGIRLSSIHKAKGLEAQVVFFLEPKGATCPHPMARSAWQRAQELNLRYVAITRAIETLVYVS